MDAAVVELDALPNPVRSAPENHHLLCVGGAHFIVAAIISGIIIRRIGLELRRAGVHQLVDRFDAARLADATDLHFARVPQLGELPVAEAVLLRVPQEIIAHRFQAGAGP